MSSRTSETAGRSARKTARRAAKSTGLRRLAQLGFAGYGLLHLLVAWLAVELAWHWPDRTPPTHGRAADQSGAMTTLARSPGGAFLLWVLAAGLAGLCLWQAAEVFRHYRHLPDPGPKRRRAVLQLLRTVGTALIYGYLAVSAAQSAVSGGRQRAQEQRTVRGVLSWPGGQEIVVAVGVIVIAIGVYLAQKGVRSAFRDEIDLESVSPALRALTFRASQVGFVLKGTALGVVGGIVGWAAATFDPKQANGLDGALRTVATASFGRWMVTVIAVGLATYAVYCFARARHPVG